MTECSRCGDCCDPITFSADALERLSAWARPDLPHPFIDPTYWTEGGWEFWRAVKAWPRMREDALFIDANWTVLRKYESATGPGVYMECNYFDSEARMCRAGPARPPVCRDYPWYGREPGDIKPANSLPPRCSFWADVPVEISGVAVLQP
jgi:Fe-S-cluster containining protein